MTPVSALTALDLEIVDLLPRTSLRVEPGQVVVAVGPPGPSHVALALALAGRLRLGAGSVQLDGSYNHDLLQRSVMLVDVPGVTQPDGEVPLKTIVGEELAMAGRKAGRAAVAEWLAERDLDGSLAMRDVPPVARVTALARLASYRPDARYVVVTSPERHGVPVQAWLDLARELADDGIGVIVTATNAVDLTAHDRVVTIGPVERLVEVDESDDYLDEEYAVAPNSDTETLTEPVDEPVNEPVNEPDVVPESKPDAEPEPEAEAEPEAEPEPPDAEPEPEPDAEAEPEPDAEAEPAAEPEPEPTADPTDTTDQPITDASEDADPHDHEKTQETPA